MKDCQKIYFITLGCKVNSRDSDGVSALFKASGFEILNGPQGAGVVYINSCTVTAEGAAKSLSAVRRARRLCPEAVIIFAGCLPQTKQGDFGADIVVGNTHRSDVVSLLQQYLKTEKYTRRVIPHKTEGPFELLPTEGGTHTRAFLKVQDGCPHRCSYCIVSQARGAPRSADDNYVLEGAKKLVADGHKEIVLCGINLACYGMDSGSNLAQLCEKLEKINGLHRIRLGSLEPNILNKELILQLSLCKKLAPHLHLPLQSGSDKILLRMNRAYDMTYYLNTVQMLRECFDHPGLTTDIMVGFPGEMQEDFMQSVLAVSEIGFLKVHVFRYSKRPGTPAAEFSGQVCETEKKHRRAILTEVAQQEGKKQKQILEKTADEIILEKEISIGIFTGTTGRYLQKKIAVPDGKQGDIIPLNY